MTNNNSQAAQTQRQQVCKQVKANLHRVAKLVNENFKAQGGTDTEEIKAFISKELDIPADKVFIEYPISGEPAVLNFGPYDDEVLDLLIDREIKILESNMTTRRKSHGDIVAKILNIGTDDENTPLPLETIGIVSEDPEEIAQQLSQKLNIPADSIRVEDIKLPQFHEKDETRLDTYGQIKTPIGASVSDILSQIEDTYGTAEEADSFKMARKMASDPTPLKPYIPKHPPIKWTQVGGTPVQNPNRATSGSGGFDLYSTVRVDIPPGCNAKIGTGIKMAIPEGWVGIICPRSGVAAKSRVVPGARIIDSDYRGEIFIDLHNRGQDTFEVLKGERYVQIIFVPVNTNLQYVDSLDDVTERGTGGFGSTGSK